MSASPLECGQCRRGFDRLDEMLAHFQAEHEERSLGRFRRRLRRRFGIAGPTFSEFKAAMKPRPRNFQ